MKRGPESLRSQIHRALRQAIARSELLPHALLPSTRDLARRLGVSRNTVLAAYEALAQERLVVSRVGSGTRVADHTRDAAEPASAKISARGLLRAAHYPRTAVRLRDPDGHLIRLI